MADRQASLRLLSKTNPLQISRELGFKSLDAINKKNSIVEISKSSNPHFRFITLIPLICSIIFILFLAILSPYFETNLMVSEYQFTVDVLGKICHQFPSRCFYFLGSNIGLCSRCFSIYLSILISAIFLIYFDIKIHYRFFPILAIILFVPLLLDGITQHYGIRESNNFLRVFTGSLAGFGVSFLLIPAYIAGVLHIAKFLSNNFTNSEGGLENES